MLRLERGNLVAKVAEGIKWLRLGRGNLVAQVGEGESCCLGRGGSGTLVAQGCEGGGLLLPRLGRESRDVG